MSSNLNPFFEAKSIAVVGASSKEGKTGHTILRNLINSGFQGQIYPINPKSDNILWLQAYPTITAVEAPIDLAVFTIPAAGLPNAMEEAGKVGVKAAIIITGGLGEVGQQDLEQEVMGAAKRYGIRVIGPNCQGVSYTHNNLCASWPLTTFKGPVAVISQSGTIGAALAGWAQEDGLGVSGVVSLGNKSDVDECDLLDHFAKDPHTKVIALNIEGVRDGQRFIETCLKVTAEKPVVVLKPGRTEKGKQAAASHTKSVAGDAQVFEAVCRKAHLIQAKDVTEFYDFTKALALTGPINSPQVSILTSSGGSGILAVDAAEEQGLEIFNLSLDIKKEMENKLPGHCVIRNPLDLTGDTDAERYLISAKILAKQAPGAFLLVFGDPIPGAAEVVEKIDKELLISPICCYIGGGETQKDEALKLHRSGYPVYPTPERAMNALKALYQYGKYLVEMRGVQSVC